MLSNLKINGFKCFDDFEIEFSSEINLLVGENDAGKSSLLSAIRILKGELLIDDDDFRDRTNPILIEVSINDNLYKMRCSFEGAQDISQIINIDNIKRKFECDSLTDDEVDSYIKKFGSDLRGNKKNKLKGLLEEFTEEEEVEVNNIKKMVLANEFSNIKFEDGKHFSDIQQNFKNFIKNDVNEIWNENISTNEGGVIKDKKLSDLVSKKLQEIKKRKEREYKDNLLPTIQEIIPTIKGMNIDLSPNLVNFSSYESKVNFYENGKSINIDKRGDGTKRRMTIALFKHESLIESENKNIYLFDEPDTHLNLRVQQDLINIFYKLIESGHQIIFTSHSPFILNLINISNIVLLKNNGEKTDKLYLKPEEADDFNEILYNLGIQNIDIFFSKYFLFYEGETELNFFSKAYYKKYKKFIEKKFIRQINCEGIDNEVIFLKNFCSIIGSDVKIISIVDKDYQDKHKTKRIMDSLQYNFPSFELYSLGIEKEFEDEFTCSQLYNCFSTELSISGISSFQELENEKAQINKFSGLLSKYTKLSKPEMGNRLAEYFEFDSLSEKLKKVISSINSLD